MPTLARSLEEALGAITDGASVLIPREGAGVAMAATCALIRRGVRGLTLIATPTASLQADLLIGAGCVAAVEAAAVSLGEFGPAPRFTAAITARAIAMRDSTCPAIHAGLQASEKGVPFMPLRALKPDVALFHAPLADRDGNVWIGQQRDLALMAHAAAKTVVTVEKLHDGNLFEDPLLAAGALGGFYLEAVAVAPRGAWPLPLPDHYAADEAHLAEYAKLAATPEGFARYLDRHVHERRAA